MNHRLFAMLLCVFAAPGYSMTAAVAPSTPAGSPSAPGTPTKGLAAPTEQAPKAGVANAPNAMTLIRPGATLSAPGVPPKSTAPVAKSATARSSAGVIPPGVGAASGVVAPPPNSAAWTTTAGGSHTMRRGTLEAVNLNPGTFKVFDQKLNFDPQQVKVFNRDGRAGSLFALKNGAKVRFTLDPKDPAQRRVAVIYVD